MRKNILFFAEVGKTNFSSKASEELLKNLFLKISQDIGDEFVKIYFYPIFDLSNLNKWIYNYKKRTSLENNFIYISSSSIKLIRDLIYIFSIIRISIINKSSNIVIYNLNNFQLNLLYLFKFLIPSKINFIQADGFLLKNHEIGIFHQVYVFSKYLYDAYKLYNNNLNINYCLPYVNRDFTITKNNEIIESSKKDKYIYFIHCGSISEYSLSDSKLEKLGLFCENRKKYRILFTSSQLVVPDYFKQKLKEYSKYFIYYNNLEGRELRSYLGISSYGLDLRDSDCFNSYIDFPSKLITYFINNLPVISTFSRSIPNIFSKLIIDFDNLDSLELGSDKNFDKDIFIDVKKFIKENSLDKSILNSLKIKI